MNREIKLDPYPILSRISHYEFKTLMNFTSVIFEVDGNIFFIRDEVQKLEDVSQMPDYIRLDWINYNKKSIGISELNKHIEFYNRQLASKSWGIEGEREIEDYLNIIMKIRRDLIINGLIS